MTENLFFESSLNQTDPSILDAVKNEFHRQNDQIELIASENIVSKAVLEAQGTVLTNKYAEGYSGKRYYGGCEYVDVVETLAIERAKKLFNCEFVNVERSWSNWNLVWRFVRPHPPSICEHSIGVMSSCSFGC